MAIDNQFGKGIGVAAGFDLGAQKPLDARIAVNTIAERDAHVENNRAYEGMIVYVAEAKKTYQLVQGNEEGQLVWQELAKEEKDRLDALEAMLNGGEGVEGGALGALQESIDEINEKLNEGGIVKEAIDAAQDAADAAQADADALEQRLDNEGGLVDRLEAVEASIGNGGNLEKRVKQAEDDIDALETKTGIKAEYEENGDVKVQATGMYKYIDEQDAKLQDNIGSAVEGMEAKVEGEKKRAEGQEAAIRQELANALAEAKSHAEAEDVKVKNAQAEKDSAQDNKILALEQLFQGENSVDNKIAAVQDDLDTFKQSQETAHQGLAQKDGELDQAIKTEKGRAEGVEQGLQSAIDAINNEESGILAQAKALDKADRDAQALVDQEQDNRLKALEDANKEGGAVKEAIDQVAQDLADFEEAQGNKNNALAQKDGELNQAIINEAARADAAEKKIAQDLANEIARADAAEKANAKAIEDESARADAEEKRIVGLVEAEAGRAAGQEAAIRQEMATEASRVDQKIADDIAAESALRVKEEQRIEKALEDAMAQEVIDRNAAIDVEKQRAEKKEGELLAAINKEVQDRESAVSGEATARQQADTALDNRLKAVEASIGDGGDLEKRVEANEAAIEVINGEGEGSIKKAVADLVDGAPQDLDTLKELSAALRDNKDVLTAIETAFDNKLSSQKTDLQKEIDDDVLVETNRAKGVEEGLQDAIDAINDAEDGILAQAKAHANGLDQAMDLRVDALETFKNGHSHESMEGRIEALENANKENGAVANAIKSAQDAADAAQDDVDAVVERLDAENGLVDRLEAVEQFVDNHDDTERDAQIAKNKAAIEVLNGDENKDGSVAKAVKAEADRAKLAEQAIQKQINEGLKCVAFDGDNEYDDLSPLS